MIITYGLFWRLDCVFWGKKNNPGNLWGSKTQSSNAIKVDFRNQRGIYALYADYELVYTGPTGAGDDRLFKRLKMHRSDHLAERWNRFSWFGTRWVTQQHELSKDAIAVHVDTVKALNILEAVAIAISEPRLNLQRGRWGDTKQYFQVKDSRL